MASWTQDVDQQNQTLPKEKRKPVRRDPEKRRQQNVQAQRRYRECRLSGYRHVVRMVL
jgi:hypothetical protein